MERNIMSELLAWKNMTHDRKPLLIYGVRQVGKTYILREFWDRYYKNCIYINFERMEIVSDFFRTN